MKKKNALASISEQLEVYKNHNRDVDILEAIKNDSRFDTSITAGLTMSDLHVILAVANGDKPTISAIVAQVSLTQGAVSKILNKLTNKQVVEKFHQPGNKKETLVELTSRGEAVYQIYQDYHQTVQKSLWNIADKYSKNELEVIDDFLLKLNQKDKKIF